MPIRFISVHMPAADLEALAVSRSRSIRLPANGNSRCSSSIRRMTARSAAETARGR